MRTTALALMLFVFAGAVVCQDIVHEWPQQYYPPAETPEPPEPDCDHETNSARRFAKIRLLPALKITSFTGKEIEYVHDDTHGTYVGKLTVDAKTITPKDFWKAYKGKYFWILYCHSDDHAYAYTIVELTPTQVKGLKGKL